MALLDTWTSGSHTHDGTRHPTYRKGTGPGVVVIHEIPGPTPSVIGFGEELVDAGYTVVMPHLFGRAEAPMSAGAVARSMRHGELGGPGVGALGMCFTGGFALAMMVDDSVAAPVLCQPSVPFAVGRRRSADLNLSPDDLATVKERVGGGCAVLGIQYASDPMTGTRFDTLDRELGDGFLRVDLPGKGHSVVTEQRSQVAVDRVLEFFAERLH
jgi:hypothetical protein